MNLSCNIHGWMKGWILVCDHPFFAVTDKDGSFVITGVRQYAKTAFPTLAVYADTAVPTIRLVTCGGAFDSTTHHYLSNIVAFGQLA